MESPFIKILRVLEVNGVGQFADIAPTLLSLYPLPDDADNQQKQETAQKVTSFLVVMEKEGLLSIDGNGFAGLGSGSGGHITWLTEIKIMATIGVKGLNYLADYKNQRMVRQVNKSVIDTNKATRTNFRRQILISSVTILIAALTGWIAWLTYQKTKASDDLEKRLNTLEKHIHTPTKDTIQELSPTPFESPYSQKNDST